MYLFGFQSCAPVPLLNIFTIDLYEINHLIFNIFSFYLIMLGSAVPGPLFKWRDMSSLTQLDYWQYYRLLVRAVSHLFTLNVLP